MADSLHRIKQVLPAPQGFKAAFYRESGEVFFTDVAAFALVDDLNHADVGTSPTSIEPMVSGSMPRSSLDLAGGWSNFLRCLSPADFENKELVKSLESEAIARSIEDELAGEEELEDDLKAVLDDETDLGEDEGDGEDDRCAGCSGCGGGTGCGPQSNVPVPAPPSLDDEELAGITKDFESIKQRIADAARISVDRLELILQISP